MDSDSDSSLGDHVDESMCIDYDNSKKVVKSSKITEKYLKNLDAFAALSLSSTSVTSALKSIRDNFVKSKKAVPIVCELGDRVQLTHDDLELRQNLEEEGDNEKPDTEISEDFERFYGTSIEVEVPDKQAPYLNFDSPAWEKEASLNRLLSKTRKSELESKSTLASDIEAQFKLAPYRISARQKKKQNAGAANSKLAGWFDMPRVTELSKEQQKDLDALEMRRVWNPKVFYKKNSLPSAKNGANGGKAGFFQVGTIAESSSDFYSDRVPKKQRKQTIVDELLADHELKAYNKRKLKYAQSKNSRLSMMARRVKMRKQKQKIRDRKFARKGANPNEGVFTTKTF